MEKESATARAVFIGSDRLPEDHPGSGYKWHVGEKIPEYERDELITTKEVLNGSKRASEENHVGGESKRRA